MAPIIIFMARHRTQGDLRLLLSCASDRFHPAHKAAPSRKNQQQRVQIFNTQMNACEASVKSL
jgi:hypothetical protein